jgi:cell wall-associated NlpC family hydrolase
MRKKASVASGKRPVHVGKVHQPTTKTTSKRVRTVPKVSVKRDAADSLATSQTPVADDASGQLPDVVKTSSQAVQTSLQIVDPIAEKRSSIVEFAQDAANYDKLSSPVRSTLMSRANSHRGTPYRFGSSGGGTFDCSGFTSAMYRKVGIKLPRTAAEQFGVGNHVGKSVLTKGDLVFFRNTAGRRGISHVGIFAGNGNFIHASSRGHAVRIDTLSSGYYANHFAGGRRLIH